MRNKTRNIIIFFVMASLLIAGALVAYLVFSHPPPSSSLNSILYIPFPGFDDGSLGTAEKGFVRWVLALFLALFLFCIHLLILSNVRRRGQRFTRLVGLILILGLPALATVAVIVANYDFYYSMPKLTLLFLIPVIQCLMLIWLPGLMVYSLPGSFLASLPLLLHYVFISLVFLVKANILTVFFFRNMDSVFVMLVAMPGFLAWGMLFFYYLPLSGHLFPKHRRLREFWRPAPLPKLKAKPQDAPFLIHGGQS